MLGAKSGENSSLKKNAAEKKSALKYALLKKNALFDIRLFKKKKIDFLLAQYSDDPENTYIYFVSGSLAGMFSVLLNWKNVSACGNNNNILFCIKIDGTPNEVLCCIKKTADVSET